MRDVELVKIKDYAAEDADVTTIVKKRFPSAIENQKQLKRFFMKLKTHWLKCLPPWNMRG